MIAACYAKATRPTSFVRRGSHPAPPADGRDGSARRRATVGAEGRGHPRHPGQRRGGLRERRGDRRVCRLSIERETGVMKHGVLLLAVVVLSTPASAQTPQTPSTKNQSTVTAAGVAARLQAQGYSG